MPAAVRSPKDAFWKRFASLVIEQMVNNERKIFFEEKEIVI